jgi:hypothetical protein
LVGSNSSDLDGREDTALIWLLDVTACPRCLLEVGEWNQLADSKVVTAFVVLIGPDSVVARVQYLARGLRSTAVTTASPSAVDGLVGRVLPNTKLLLSHQGAVASPAPAAITTCPPDEEYCIETPYSWQGCHGTYCYSDREFCCIIIE